MSAQKEYESQLESEYPIKLQKLVETKEKEIKVKFRRQLEIDKKNYEAKSKENYEKNLQKEQKKLESERAEYARQKSAYSVMQHQYEMKKKEMSKKLKEKELKLMKKQAEVKSGLSKYIEPDARSEVLLSSPIQSVMPKPKPAPSPLKSPFKIPSANRSSLGQDNIGISPSQGSTKNALLPFSRALVNKAINEIGIDKMINNISLSPEQKYQDSQGINEQYLIKGRSEIDEFHDIDKVPKKYI